MITIPPIIRDAMVKIKAVLISSQLSAVNSCLLQATPMNPPISFPARNAGFSKTTF